MLEYLQDGCSQLDELDMSKMIAQFSLVNPCNVNHARCRRDAYVTHLTYVGTGEIDRSRYKTAKAEYNIEGPTKKITKKEWYLTVPAAEAEPSRNQEHYK